MVLASASRTSSHPSHASGPVREARWCVPIKDLKRQLSGRPRQPGSSRPHRRRSAVTSSRSGARKLAPERSGEDAPRPAIGPCGVARCVHHPPWKAGDVGGCRRARRSSASLGGRESETRSRVIAGRSSAGLVDRDLLNDSLLRTAVRRTPCRRLCVASPRPVSQADGRSAAITTSTSSRTFSAPINPR
jgi:hypothetical protein